MEGNVADISGTSEGSKMHNQASKAAVILVVDDDALINMNAVDMVEQLGHTALEAYSGAEALTILGSQQTVDLLITDYAMPGMNGVELANQARQLRPDLPIVLATGYSELPEGIEIDLPRLPKPYQQSDLANHLMVLLNERAPANAGSAQA
ncbi:MAG: CheY-like chemotaxis protein [Devosia sp.]|tara:strand:- start:70 stop:522 length:453 start_codon:yes stop_codon:yes gene_type:complete